MSRRLFATLLLVGLVIPAALRAHDPSKHKGRPVKGEILSVAQDRFELKTGKGTKTVLLSEKPKIENGDAEGSVADLKKGRQVTVFGTTLASGEVVAHEIVLGQAPTKSHGR